MLCYWFLLIFHYGEYFEFFSSSFSEGWNFIFSLTHLLRTASLQFFLYFISSPEIVWGKYTKKRQKRKLLFCLLVTKHTKAQTYHHHHHRHMRNWNEGEERKKIHKNLMRNWIVREIEKMRRKFMLGRRTINEKKISAKKTKVFLLQLRMNEFSCFLSSVTNTHMQWFMCKFFSLFFSSIPNNFIS